MKRKFCSISAGIVMGFALLSSSAMAQVTTGTVTGRVIDSTGGIVPNAKVVLVSEARGTRSAAVSPTTVEITSSRTSRPTRTQSRSPRRRSKPCGARGSL